MHVIMFIMLLCLFIVISVELNTFLMIFIVLYSVGEACKGDGMPFRRYRSIEGPRDEVLPTGNRSLSG